MHYSIENVNYFNDPRTGNPAPDKITVWLSHDAEVGPFYEEERELPTKFEVCSVCHGNGSHVNPSIDCNGLSAEDFYEDPDFAEDYFSGTYDVPCNNCGGKRVEAVIDEDRCTQVEIDAYYDGLQAERDYRAECLAEIRMGC